MSKSQGISLNFCTYLFFEISTVRTVEGILIRTINRLMRDSYNALRKREKLSLARERGFEKGDPLLARGKTRGPEDQIQIRRL